MKNFSNEDVVILDDGCGETEAKYCCKLGVDYHFVILNGVKTKVRDDLISVKVKN